jgi:DNA-binding transcriptional LysR family regulator
MLAETERALGARIFERTARGLMPTDYGKCLIKHSRHVIAALIRADDELKSLQRGAGERLTIGANPHTAVAVIPQSVAMMKSRRPRTTIIVREGHTEAHLSDLSLGRIDLFVGRIPPDCPDTFGVRVLSTEPMRLVVGAKHRLASRKRVNWRDLAQYPWALPPMGTALREPLVRALEAHGIDVPGNCVETLSLPTLQAYLNTCDAVAAVAPQVARYYEELRLMKSLPLMLSNVGRSSGIVWSPRGESPALEAFIQCVEASYVPARCASRSAGESRV